MVIMVNAELRIIHIRCDFDITGRTKKCCRILDCAECDEDMLVNMSDWSEISIHALHAECDNEDEEQKTKVRYFNPRTPCRVRRVQMLTTRAAGNFNPRTPCGVRHEQISDQIKKFDISIHALHAECDYKTCISNNTCKISIHALHAECDIGRVVHHVQVPPISIHALHAECDASPLPMASGEWIFQSTHSMRLSLIHI